MIIPKMKLVVCWFPFPCFVSLPRRRWAAKLGSKKCSRGRAAAGLGMAHVWPAPGRAGWELCAPACQNNLPEYGLCNKNAQV